MASTNRLRSFYINPGDCVSETLGPPDLTFQDGTYFDDYLLQWPGGDLTIILSSSEFDEYLIIFEPPGYPNGQQVDVDDQYYDKPEVYSVTNAPAGTYTIFANTYQSGSGAYQLCISQSDAITPTPTPTHSFTPTQTVTPSRTYTSTPTPTFTQPPTPTPTLGGASSSERADYNWNGIIDAYDLMRFIKEWKIPSNGADIDANQQVDGRDEWAFSRLWFGKNAKAVPTRVAIILGSLSEIGVQTKHQFRSTEALLRQGIPNEYPEIPELVQLGRDTVPAILQEFQQPAELLDDLPLSYLALALELLGDERAIPVLADWLEQNMFGELVYAPDFVTHALKVINRQGGLNTTGYYYLTEEMLDTIAQARIGQIKTTASCCDCADKATGDAGESCQKTLHISGLNAQGQQVTTPVSFKVFKRSTLKLIDDTTDPAKKQKYTELYNSYVSADNDRYGNSEYVPVDGSEAGHQANCGGTVCRMVINELAAEKGIPINLGNGTSDADSMVRLGKAFGDEVPLSAINTVTVISHESKDTGASIHVEVPLTSDSQNAVVLSKDQQGLLRQHTVSKTSSSNQFQAVYNAYDKPVWWWPFSTMRTKYYRINPDRIIGIVVDSSGCPCNPNAPDAIPVTVTRPTESQTSQRVVTVEGTVGDPNVTSEAVLRVNGTPQQISIMNQTFSAVVVLRSGDNLIEVYVETPDGRRGCAKKTIKSTTPKTSISATLTWNLDQSDVDLYVTQPNGHTAWYLNKNPYEGGRLDVDNTQGYGPENYFLSAPEGGTVPEGIYSIRVHYFRDRKADAEHPVRAVGWRVVLLLNEGTPYESREIFSGILSLANSSNASPGSTGADWATAKDLDFKVPGQQ